MMRKGLLMLLYLGIASLMLEGCIIPRMAGGAVKGVARGAVTVVDGVTEVVTAPF